MFGLKSIQCLALRPHVTPSGSEFIYKADKLRIVLQVFNSMCSVVASRKWAYRSGPLSGLLIWCPVVLSLWGSFEDQVPVDKLHWCPGFDWVAVIWVKDRVPGWQFRVWPPACHYQYKYLYISTLIFDIHASQYWYPSISVSSIDVHAILLFTYIKFTHYTGSTVHWKRIPWCAAL